MSTIKTLADLLDRLGEVPLERIRFQPFPGTATLQDVINVHRQESRLCELIEGVLVEKTVGYRESSLAGFLAGLLNALVIPRNLGIVTGTDGAVELKDGLVRIPDVAFTSWDRLPDRRYPPEPIPRIAPNLAIGLVRRGNTSGEMTARRRDYFAAGTQLVWEINPTTRSVAVYTSSTQATILSGTDTLGGGTVLPGFTLAVHQLFAELDRHG